MRIWILELRSVIKYFLVLAAAVLLVSVLSITGMNAIGAFASERQIPIYSVECAERKAAITFDCAWGASDIPSILDTLKNEDVKATFFVVGQWAEKFPDMIRMISDAGHDVANHSYSHLRMGALDRAKIREEIAACTRTIEQLTGVKTDLFRPPYGDYSNNVVNAARGLGCYTIQWNVDSLDWKPGITKDEILKRIHRKLKPGSILLFHNDTPHTAELLPSIIAAVKEDGYTLVPVSQLILRENFVIDHEGRQKKKE